MKRRTETITIQEAIDQFVAEKRAEGLVDRTVIGYKEDITRFTRNIQNLKELTSEYLTTYTNEMLSRMKPVSVNHYLRGYRAFLYWCMNNHYINEYKIKLVKTQEAPIKIYTIEDIEKLLEKPTHRDSYYTWRTWAVTAFALGTGARAGTIVNIHLSDIDFNAQEVVYRHTKNKKSSVIPLCDNLVKMLKYYINEFSVTDLLFPNDKDEPLQVRGLNASFKRYCKLRNVEYQSFHALRHTFAKQFIVNGGNPFQLQKMLDHQSLAMSQHYTHLFGQDLHNVVNDFSPLAKMSSSEKIKRKC